MISEQEIYLLISVFRKKTKHLRIDHVTCQKFGLIIQQNSFISENTDTFQRPCICLHKQDHYPNKETLQPCCIMIKVSIHY
jgi:hypothetical protein